MADMYSSIIVCQQQAAVIFKLWLKGGVWRWDLHPAPWDFQIIMWALSPPLCWKSDSACLSFEMVKPQKTYWPNDPHSSGFCRPLKCKWCSMAAFFFTTCNTLHVRLYITAHKAKKYAKKIPPKKTSLFTLPPKICSVCLLAVVPSAAV